MSTEFFPEKEQIGYGTLDEMQSLFIWWAAMQQGALKLRESSEGDSIVTVLLAAVPVGDSATDLHTRAFFQTCQCLEYLAIGMKVVRTQMYADKHD